MASLDVSGARTSNILLHNSPAFCPHQSTSFEQWKAPNDETKYSLSLRTRNFIFVTGRAPSRALSVPPPIAPPPLRSLSVPPRDHRATSVPPFPHDPLSPLDLLSEYERRPFERCLSPTPIKCGRWAPRSSEVAFDSDGNLIFGILKSFLFDIFCCLWKS